MFQDSRRAVKEGEVFEVRWDECSEGAEALCTG